MGRKLCIVLEAWELIMRDSIGVLLVNLLSNDCVSLIHTHTPVYLWVEMHATARCNAQNAETDIQRFDLVGQESCINSTVPMSYHPSLPLSLEAKGCRV